MSNILVEVDKISKAFGEKSIFEELSFNIKKGETIAIIGYSGCGKTTLLRVIGGFEVVNTGAIRVDGVEVSGPSQKSIIVGQEHNQLLPWKTAINNVSWPIFVTKKVQDKKEAREIAKKYLLDLNIESADFEKYPIQLSGGMKQRITIARALALKPELLLLDEPFGSLDDLTRTKAQNVVKNACKTHGVTTVLVTHNISEAIKMANRILVFTPKGSIKIVNNSANVEQRIKKLLDVA